MHIPKKKPSIRRRNKAADVIQKFMRMCCDSQQLKLGLIHFVSNIRFLQKNVLVFLHLKKRRMIEMKERWQEVEDKFLQRSFQREISWSEN
jgi:hypothetical protein